MYLKDVLHHKNNIYLICVVCGRKKTIFVLNPLRERKRKGDKEGLFFKKPFIIEMKRIMLNDDQVDAEIQPYAIPLNSTFL